MHGALDHDMGDNHFERENYTFDLAEEGALQ